MEPLDWFALLLKMFVLPPNKEAVSLLSAWAFEPNNDPEVPKREVLGLSLLSWAKMEPVKAPSFFYPWSCPFSCPMLANRLENNPSPIETPLNILGLIKLLSGKTLTSIQTWVLLLFASIYLAMHWKDLEYWGWALIMIWTLWGYLFWLVYIFLNDERVTFYCACELLLDLLGYPFR